MSRNNGKRDFNQDALRSLNSAKQHFLTANREDILALNDVIEFVKQMIEGYGDIPSVTALSSLLTTMQVILEVIIKKVIEPLRTGDLPADPGEIISLVSTMVDDELSKLRDTDPSDPRLQILWSIKEILVGKKKRKTAKKVRRITVE